MVTTRPYGGALTTFFLGQPHPTLDNPVPAEQVGWGGDSWWEGTPHPTPYNPPPVGCGGVVDQFFGSTWYIFVHTFLRTYISYVRVKRDVCKQTTQKKQRTGYETVVHFCFCCCYCCLVVVVTTAIVVSIVVVFVVSCFYCRLVVAVIGVTLSPCYVFVVALLLLLFVLFFLYLLSHYIILL